MNILRMLENSLDCSRHRMNEQRERMFLWRMLANVRLILNDKEETMICDFPTIYKIEIICKCVKIISFVLLLINFIAL